jgi:hypothetical protein
VLLTCGAFTPQGEFLELAELDLERLQAAWQETVFALYLAEDKIEPEVVENMRTWPHSKCVEKGDRSNLPERPEGCCAQIGPVPFFHRTLDDVEAVVAMFSPEQLAELEQFVRHARLEKTRGKGESALDLPPLDLGRSLQPLGTREQWYDEMLEERV